MRPVEFGPLSDHPSVGGAQVRGPRSGRADLGRAVRLVVVTVLLQIVLQAVVGRAHVALWSFLLTTAHLQPDSAAAAVVVPDLMMQAAAAYAVARAAGVRSWRPGGLVLLTVVAALVLGAHALAGEQLQPHAWQLATGLLLAGVGSAGGVLLRLRMLGPDAARDGSTGPPYRSAYGDGAAPAVRHVEEAS